MNPEATWRWDWMSGSGNTTIRIPPSPDACPKCHAEPELHLCPFCGTTWAAPSHTADGGQA